MCSKVCSFARLSFGLIETTNRTNRQFAQSNSCLNQTKCQPNQSWQKNTFFNTFFRKSTHVFFWTHVCFCLLSPYCRLWHVSITSFREAGCNCMYLSRRYLIHCCLCLWGRSEVRWGGKWGSGEGRGMKKSRVSSRPVRWASLTAPAPAPLVPSPAPSPSSVPSPDHSCHMTLNPRAKVYRS